MTPTPVGMRCPECAQQKTRVQRPAFAGDEPRVTFAIIALCVIAFLGSGGVGVRGGGGTLVDKWALVGIFVHDGDWWRLVTGGFLHGGLLHIFFNMYLLYMLGSMLEPVLGSLRFGVLYMTALLCGSFGALVQTTVAPTVGASGAVFGLMGAAAIELHRRGIDPLRSDIGALIALNLLFSFLPGFNISVGGHIGGLVGGGLAALALSVGERQRSKWLGIGLCVALAAVAVAASFAIAGTPRDLG
jgi:membrane associated rhomboid family serine protease